METPPYSGRSAQERNDSVEDSESSQTPEIPQAETSGGKPAEKDGLHLERVAALRDITVAITSTLDLRTVLDILAAKIHSFLSHSSGTIRLLNRETGDLEPVASWNVSPEELNAFNGKQGGLCWAAFEADGPLVIDDVPADPRSKNPDFDLKHKIWSYVGIALTAKGDKLGVLSFHNKGQRGFHRDEIGFLTTLAGHAAIAIHNAQLHEKLLQQTAALEKANQELKARSLQQGVMSLLGNLALARNDLSSLLDEAAVLAAHTLGVEYAKVLELLPDGQTLLLRAGIGWKDGLVGQATVGTSSTSQAGYTLETREPVIVEDLRTETRFSGPALLLDHGIVSGMSVVVHGKNGPYGVMGVHATQRRRFSTDDINFLQSLANLLAAAVERQKTEEALRQSEERFKIVARATNDAVWDWNLLTNEVWWNEGVTTLFRYPVEQVGTQLDWWYRNIHPEDAERIVSGVRAAIQSGQQTWSDEYRYRCGDGSYAFVIDRGYVIYENGSPTRMIGSMTDITDAKQARAELESSHERLRALAGHLQAAREEERTRVAREIHDELGQALTGLKMDVAWLRKKLVKDQEPLREKTDSMLALMDQTIQSVRRISTELRPGVLDDLGLAAAIEWQIHEFQNRTGIKCVLASRLDDIRLDHLRSTALFRIFQETLTNIGRHARATKVSIKLERKNRDVSLQVQDNGNGIPKSKLSDRRSLGILGMRERALLLGGEFTINGSRGKGTIVTARIPIDGV
ncbi:MAG TPA: GAF domain-containing protein [Candidatus Binatia bacterium]